eukprot:m.176157 g.176157  ORF g.176157 m.176157 type:complete len:615 (+) comp14119_c0_seq1:252-2096(+)
MPKMRRAGLAGAAPPPHADSDVAADDGLVDEGSVSMAEWVEALGSEDASQREVAVSTIGAMLSEQSNAELAISQNVHVSIIKLLGEDPSTAVRADAAGALRNLATCGMDDISTHLVNDGVIQAICATFPSCGGRLYRASQGGADGVSDEAMEEMVSTVEQLAHLLGVLCEASADAAVAVTRSVVPAVVLRCIGVSTVPQSTTYALTSCLQTLSEDNEPIARLIQGSPDTQATLSALLAYSVGSDGEQASIRTAAAGVCINAGVTSLLTKVAESLTHTVKITTASFLSELAIHLPKVNKESSQALRDSIREYDDMLSAQHNALEILANLASGMARNDDDEGEATAAEAVAAQWEEVCGPDAIRTAAVAALELCAPIDQSLQVMLAGHDSLGSPILVKFVQVQSRALAFLQNLLMHISVVEDIEFARKLFRYVGELCSDPPRGSDFDPDFLDAATATVWATLRGCAEADVLDALQLTADHIEVFCNCALNMDPCLDAAINVAGILGILGQHTASGPVIGSVAMSLLHDVRSGVMLLGVEQSPWLLAEALNSIFDVFAEPEANEVVRDVQMMEALQDTLPALQDAMRSGNFEAETEEKVGEVLENLSNFIAYKAEQM